MVEDEYEVVETAGVSYVFEYDDGMYGLGAVFVAVGVIL